MGGCLCGAREIARGKRGREEKWGGRWHAEGDGILDRDDPVTWLGGFLREEGYRVDFEQFPRMKDVFISDIDMAQ
jgi:hypothetical protein